eukprot:4833817-Alexandrium_andersonii.AAC.1
MSASLVGSEMCIRDRRLLVRACAPAVWMLEHLHACVPSSLFRVFAGRSADWRRTSAIRDKLAQG